MSDKAQTPFLETHDTRKAALDFASRGFPVFPCCWPDGDKCGCGRNHQGRDIGKAPLTTHGFKDATLDPQKVVEYCRQYPRANVGIALRANIFVIDVDILKDGYESLAKFQELIGVLPDTLRITSGSGGAHLVYSTQVAINGNKALPGYPGIDIKTLGGYMIWPPSLHVSGGFYEIAENRPIAPAPEALIALLVKLLNGNPQNGTTHTAPIANIITDGTRDVTLVSLAGSLRHRGLSEETIYLSLSEVNRKQCQPPLPDAQVRKIARSVGRYEPSQPQHGFRGGIVL